MFSSRTQKEIDVELSNFVFHPFVRVQHLNNQGSPTSLSGRSSPTLNSSLTRNRAQYIFGSLPDSDDSEGH